MTVRGSWWLIAYEGVMLTGGYFLLTHIEYSRRRRFLSEVTEVAAMMEEPYLIGEMELPALTEEEKLWREFFQDIGKTMKEHVKIYQKETKEYKEYI